MKKLLLIVAGLIVFLIVAALAAPYFISADTVKNTLLQRIEAATGRHVNVDGKFQLRFFPIAGVTMENVTLTNPASYGDTKPLMALKSLDVDVAVIPLLSGTIEIRKLVLDEPQINLHVSKDGVKNWLPPQKTQQIPEAAGSPSAAHSSSSIPLPANLSLNDVKMRDGAVAYNDEEAKEQWNLQKINASLSLSGVSSPFAVDASSEWNGKKITIKGTLATLRSFLSQERTKIDADIDSDLLSLKLAGDIEKSVYTGKAEVKSSSLKALMAWLNPSAAPIHAQGELALNLSSDVECASQNCDMANASLTLDKIQAKGAIKANWAKKPQIDVELTTGVLDFNPFLSQHADAGSWLMSDAYADSGHWSDKPMDLSGLRAINATANIAADGIVVNKITLGKTTLHAKLENGKLNADVVDAVMYGGKGNITLTVNAADSPPAFEKHVSLKGVQVQPLLKDAMDMSRLSGAADIEIGATAHGKSEKELVESSAGNGQFALSNGTIEGVDLASIALKKSGGTEKTPITSMKGSFTIAQGVISNKDLVMTLPTLNITGQGDINLPAYTINYHLTPQVVQQAADKTAAAKTGVAVPVIVEGSLEKPNIHPDLNAALQNALKDPQQFKEQLKNTRDSLKDQLKNPDGVKNLKNLLQGL